MSRREKREQEEKKEKERKKNQKKEKQKDNLGKKIVKIVLKTILIIILLLILLIGCFIGWLGFTNNWNWNQMLKKGAKQVALFATGQTEADLANLKPIYCLVLGISTDEGIELTDTIMICAYYPRTQQASMLSIPRDTFVGKSEATAGGNDKINSRYQVSGINGILSSVNKLTGLNIENYVIIRNGGLIELVDAIGGVEFDVPINMDYDDPGQELAIHLKKGQQKLNGIQAEGLVRFRHNNDNTSYPVEYGDNDLGRMKTQRNFIVETVKQTITAKNVFKVKDIIDIAYEYIETNLSIGTIKDYVPYAVNINAEEIKSAVLPGAPIGPPEVPLWFYEVNKKETAKLIDELYGEEDSTENTSNTNTDNNTSGNTSSSANSTSNGNNSVTKTEASKIKVEILNGSGSEKTLTAVKKALTTKGYTVSKTATTTSTSKTTIINKTNVDSKFEENIKELLGVGNISTSSVSSSNVDITIIIGKDYK